MLYSFCATTITLLATLITIFIVYFKWKFQYWQRRNVPYLKPNIPWGNSVNYFKTRENTGLRLKRYYHTMKSNGWKHGGLFLFSSPVYTVVDLEYMKNVLQNDFEYFTDKGFYYNEKDDPLSANLFLLGGHMWRQLRPKLTPTFTSAKMKMMFQTVLDCAPRLLEKIALKTDAIDIRNVVGCFLIDIIGSCAFGIDCNTFEDDDSLFPVYGRKIAVTSPFLKLKVALGIIFPRIAEILRLKITDDDVSAFFIKTVKDSIELRQKNGVRRADFLQLLIDLNVDGTSLTLEQITAQCYIFFVAGFDTSSATISFALYELAKNATIQEQVRQEIVDVLDQHNEMSYEAIQKMKYMDQVLMETLRKYPPLPYTTRRCVKDYQVPDTDVVIEKGIFVMLPIMGIHYDEDYFPDPEKFDPDRFTDENVNSRHQYAYIPFGAGPRVCIGQRFGLMQSKVALASLLKNYKFSVNEKTHEPLKFKPEGVILAAEGGIWLDSKKL